MEFTSILDLHTSPYADMPRQIFYLDLNINQIIERIAFFWGNEVQKYYYYLPADKECEDYRRAVFQDVKNPVIYDGLCHFVERMKERLDAQEKRKKLYDSNQKAVWFIREVGYYCDAIEGLKKLLEQENITSEGFKLLKSHIATYLSSEAYCGMVAEVNGLREEMSTFRLQLCYEKDKLIVSEEIGENDYEDFLKSTFPNHEKNMRNPFTSFLELSKLETEVIKIFQKKHADFFKKIVHFYKAYEEYEREVIIQFGKEITYYLSFILFERKMMEYGCEFVTPSCSETQNMEAGGLYDLALACAHLTENKTVISNRFDYREGESFFVLTGPNQGGKTTFARSLGQLIYFTKMGLDVPARSANVHYFTHILTHFSVEESVETGRGKLKEELIRLEPMMKENYSKAFVVINELFTTAANYDACIMGKKVLEHFIGQECMGIYVTHLKELADAHEKVVSLRAMLNEQKVQSFKIMRSEAEESACASIQVNKYKLTYEQLRERLKKENK